MCFEKIAVDTVKDGTLNIPSELILYEEDPDDNACVRIECNVAELRFVVKSQNLFSALQDLRRKLEGYSITVLCNGAARNVYASPMQMSMGAGRKAYVLQMCRQAKSSDIVDIFERAEGLCIVNVDEQDRYYTDWLKSLK